MFTPSTRNIKLAIVSFFLLLSNLLSVAQTSITTTHTQNSINKSVTFNVRNTNSYSVVVNAISCNLQTVGNDTCEVLYNTTAINSSSSNWTQGVVGNGQNGWVLASTGVTSVAAAGVYRLNNSLTITIPPLSTYGFCVSNVNGNLGSMALSTGQAVDTFASNGVYILTGGNIGWAGNVIPFTPTSYPMGLVGGISFNRLPIITSFSPSIAASGSTVTLTGSGFTGASAVYFGGTSAISFNVLNDTAISAVVGSGASGTVSVITSGGLGSLAGFVFNNPSATMIPFSGSNNVFSSTTLCTHAGCGVNYNNNANGYSILNGTAGYLINISGNYSTESGIDLIKIFSGSGIGGTLLATYSGAGSINYSGTSGQTLTVQFISNGSVVSTGLSSTVTYTIVAQPIISSFSPTSAASGATVTLTGSNFTGATSVTFGGTVASSFVVVNSSTITAVVGNGASGNVSVTTSTGGTGSLAGFNYTGGVSILTNAIAGMTLQCALGSGNSTRTSVAYNPIFNLYYSANAGGTSYPMETFTGGGSYLATISPNYDYRGLWWNSNTNQLEGNGYSSGGIFAESLNAANGYPLGSGNVMVANSQPDAQSHGDFDYNNNQIIYYYSGRIYQYTRNTNTLVTTLLISGLPVSNSNLNSNSIFYTGIDGKEYAVYDYISRSLYFINRSSGAYVGTCTLPANAPNPNSFAAAWANGLFWLFNGTDYKWYSYQVTVNSNPALAPTITSFTPIAGVIGTTVTVTGTNFTSVSAVIFGGTSASSFNVVNATTIVATVAAGASGNVSVVTNNGIASLAGFTFTGPISTLIPSSGYNSVSGNTTLCTHAGCGVTYSNSVNGYTVLIGVTGYAINIAGNYTTESGLDQIRIYAGAGTTGTLLATYSGTGTINYTGTAGQTLTVQFSSDGSVVYTGLNSTVTYAIVTPPTISSFSPTSATRGNTVTITGSNFTGVNAVSFGGVAATSYNVVNATTITAVVGNSVSGSVSVTTIGGTATLSGFTYIAPMPTISSISPTSASSGRAVYIYGTGFTGATSVSFGGVPATSFYVSSDTYMYAYVGNGASGIVAVTTPGGTATLAGFTYIVTPVVSSFSPSAATRGNTVTIYGRGFTGTTNVSFGGTTASSFSVNNDNSISAIVSSGASGTISVTNSAGTGYLAGFTYIYPTPVITSFSPTSSASGRAVYIYGTGFTGATSVSFGGVPATSFYVSSDTYLYAYVGNGATGSVSVSTPGGTTSLPGFVYLTPPSIASFSPYTATKGATVTIYGSSFTGTTSVSFGGTTAASFSIVNDNMITAVVGIGSTGSISVTNAAGTNSIAGFTYIPPVPVITSFSPTSAPSGRIVYIYGTGFIGTTGVSFGGVAATSFYVSSDTYMYAYVGTGASGSVNVTTPGGIGSLAGFTFQPPPAVLSISPSSATRGDTITIFGSGFSVGVTGVSFGGTNALSYTVVNDRIITAVVNSGTSGRVGVTTSAGTGYLAGFTYNSPAPVITSFSPTSATRGNYVYIYGTGFTGASSVTIGGVPVTSFYVSSDTYLYAVVGSGASGNVIVTTPGGSVSYAGFTYLPAAPVVNSFSPTSAGTGMNVIISGSGFTGTTSVSFGGTPAASLIVTNDNSITATVGVGTTGFLTVTTPSGTTNYAGFTYLASPTIASFSPITATQGGFVNIYGSGLSTTRSVSFGGTPAASFYVVNDNYIYAYVGYGASGNVSVTTIGGTASLTGFTYTGVRPSVASFTPTFASIGATVTITGNNFLGATSVTFGGVAASSFNVVNTNTITAVVGVGASGSVAVTNASGSDSVSGFQYIQVPFVTSFTPFYGCAGTTVTINGTGFTGATSVSFGGIPAVSFVVNSATSITAVVASGSVTGKVFVTTPNGTTSSASNYYVGSSLTSYAYITNEGSNNVSVINTFNNSVVATIPVGSTPVGVAISPDASKAYITNYGSGSISVINTATNTVTNTISIGSSPEGIVATADGTKVYAANSGSSTISVINTATNTVTSTISVGSSTYGLCISPDGSRVYAISNGNSSVSVINTTTNTIIATVTVGSSPWGASVSPDGSKVYVANRSANSVSVISTATNTVIATIPVGTSPYTTSVSPDGTRVYVTNNSTGTVSVIDAATNTVIATVTVGSSPWGLSVTPDGRSVYVANQNTNNITVINTSTNSVSSTITVGTKPDSWGNFMALGVLPCPPVISSFSPTSSSDSATVIIYGNNFIGVTAVSFGGVPASSFSVANANTIIAIVGTGATGKVKVTSIGGADSLAGFVFLPPVPVINSFSPTSATRGNTVYIFGSGLSGATNVTFGGVAASSFKVGSDNYISAIVGNGASGSIRVTTAGGSATLAGFTYLSSPTIVSFSPVSASRGNTVTITGSGFTNATNVTFGGTAATSYYTINDSTIIATVGNGSSGNVVVTSNIGSGSLGGFTYQIPVPAITSISPTSASTGTYIYIYGSGFTGATSVYFGGTRATSFYVNSDTYMYAVVAAGSSGIVSVVTPGGTGSLSGFTYIPPAPIISSFTPTSAGNGVNVTISGSGFTGATIVSFGGTRALSFSVTSDNAIVATVGNGTSGTVSVTTPGGTASLNGFTFVLPPSIASFSPITATQGGFVNIYGSGFTGTTGVSFGGTPARSFYVVNDNYLYAYVAYGASGNVSITTNGGSASLSGFTYTGPVPLITSFTPTTASIGTTVTIKGANFSGASSVCFGGINANSFFVQNDTTILAVVSVGASGNVKVTTASGADSMSGFRYVVVPGIASFTPNYGCPGTSVTIVGSDFLGSTAVSFGGVSAVSYVINSATSITAVVPIGGVTGKIAVTTPDGVTSSTGSYYVGSSLIPYAYLINYSSASVSVLNTNSNTVTSTVAVGTNPFGIGIKPDGSSVYVTNQGSSTVSVINTSTNTVTATIPVGQFPCNVCFSPDGTKAYVVNYSGNTISVVNTSTNAVIATISAGSSPWGIAISPDGSKLYVANRTTNSVSVINTASNSTIASITVGATPWGVCISPDGNRVYVSNETGSSVSVINTLSNTVSATITVGTNPYAINISPDGSKVYVTNYNGNSVSVINTNTNTVAATIPVGTGPQGVSFTPDGSKAYINNFTGGTVSVINTTTNSVLQSFTTGSGTRSFGSFITNSVAACPPIVASFTPTVAGTGTAVFIKGSNFTTASSVTFGASLAATFRVLNDTTIIAIVGNGSSGSISVTTTTGTSSLSGFGYCFAPTKDTIAVSGCASVTYKSKVYTKSTVVRDTVFSVFGCDSIYHLVNITVKSASTSTTNATINQGNLYLFNGTNYAVAGTYTVHLTNAVGCDSAATLVLTVTTITNYTVSGTVKNPLGTSIPSVSIAVNGTQTTTSDASGNYSISSTANSNNIIMPSKNNDKTVANGINGTDISLIQSHILKKVILNSPYKLIAADVNNDGAVNGTDIALIKSLILKHITQFSGNRLWSFIDSSYKFPVPTKPFPYFDSISISNITSNQVAKNFIGVKLGDVNYDWNAAVLGIDSRATPIELFNDNIVVNSATSEVRVPIKVKNFRNIMGMQYTLNFNSDALELKSVVNNHLNVDYNTDYATDGKIPFLWVDAASEARTLSDSAVLFELVFNKKAYFIKEDINLTSDVTAINAFDGNYNTVSIRKVGGEISENMYVANTMTVYPNPAKESIVIKGNHIDKIQVIDNFGKVIKLISLHDASNPAIKVGSLTSGVYHLRMITSDGKVNAVNFIKE